MSFHLDWGWSGGVIVEGDKGHMVIHHLKLYAIQVHVVHLDPCHHSQALSLYLSVALLCLGEGPAVVVDGPVLQLPLSWYHVSLCEGATQPRWAVVHLTLWWAWLCRSWLAWCPP